MSPAQIEASQNHNQTTITTISSSSKTMSTNEAPLAADDEAAGGAGVGGISDTEASNGDGSSSSSTTTTTTTTTTTSTTMKPLCNSNCTTFSEADSQTKQDEVLDLEASGTELTRKQVAMSDSNEAQENKLSPFVSDPSEDLMLTRSNGTIGESGEGEMDEQEVSGDLAVDADSDEDVEQQLSRRLFLNKQKPNSISDEIKRLKNQGSKLLAKNPLKRKKSKKKTSNKPMRPRLGTTTVDYGNLLNVHNPHHNQLSSLALNPQISSTSNAISNTLRQHFPNMLSNPTQQLSTTVQKLIMSKLSPSATNQQTRAISINGKRAPLPHQLHTSAQQFATGLYQQHQQPASSYLDNSRLVEALSQLATNNDDSPSLAYASPSSAHHKAHIQQPLPGTGGGNKMIPIEIIGLDPTVTNNILQSYDSEQAGGGAGGNSGGQAPDSMQMYPTGANQEPTIYHHQDSSGQQVAALAQQMQQLKAADGLSKIPRASSILHIHHFHTTPSKPVSPQLVEGEQQEPAGGGLRAPSPQNQPPAQRVIAKTAQQKVYVNDKGQLVYLSVEDQSSPSGGSIGGEQQQQPDGSAGAEQPQQQQQTSDGHEARPAGDPSNQLAADQQQQQQDFQQAQQDYTQQVAGQLQIDTDQQQQQASGAETPGNQQEPQQVESINLAHDQPITLQANGPFRTLVNHSFGSPQQQQQQQVIYSAPSRNLGKQQIGDPKAPRVYLTGNGQTISLIGGRGNAIQVAGEGVAGGDGDSDRQQLLMVAYKPQQQFRNITEQDLLAGQRNPYNEGQESKASFLAANHLFAGAPQLLKGSSLMLRPFPGHFGAQSNQFFNNITDDYASDLMRLRQQAPINFSDLVARLNGSLPIGGDLAHLDHHLRTGNGSLHFSHGMLSSTQLSPSLPASSPQPTLLANVSSSSLPAESIPLTIVPIHQVANMSYQLGSQLQAGRLPLQDNRVPSPTSPFTSNPALKGLMADLSGNLHHSHLSNYTRPGFGAAELAGVQTSSWMGPDGSDKLLQSNGYGNNNNNNNNRMLAALMALRNNATNLLAGSSASPQNLLLENLTFLKHLREVKERLKQASEPPPAAPFISHHHLLSLNSTSKLSNDELISILNELRLNNGSTINLSPMQQQQPPQNSVSSGIPLIESALRPGKFGQPQSSSPAPQLIQPVSILPALPPGANSVPNAPIQLIQSSNSNNKHIRSKISSSNQSGANNGFINTGEHQQKSPATNYNTNKDHRTAMESQQSDVSVGLPPLPMPPPPNINKHHQQVVSMVSDDSEFISDSNGLGTIALAFIFISLITLTLLAASMIYRHRRRSVGRCADLPSRSRLNLTQRTKHFVRSNFVNPGDVSSIKSVNGLNSGGSSSSSTTSSSKNIHKRSLTSNSKSSAKGKANNLADHQKGSSDEVRMGSPATTTTSNRTSENRYLSKQKPFGQPSLSTFNTNPQSVVGGGSDKYHFSSNSSKQSAETVTDSATDIKTLNTRLQKPPYLKSLISTPDCLLWNKKQQAQSNSSNKSDCDTDAGNAFYLNIRNKHTGLKSVSSPMSEASCKLSPSFKKNQDVVSELSHHQRHQYGSPVKEITNQLGASNYRQQAASETSSKQHAYSNRSRPSTVMSTIHSIRDSDSKSSNSSSPTQIKRQVNIQINKPNNLPAPKHLVAGGSQLSHHTGANSDETRNSNSNQIDRL